MGTFSSVSRGGYEGNNSKVDSLLNSGGYEGNKYRTVEDPSGFRKNNSKVDSLLSEFCLFLKRQYAKFYVFYFKLTTT